MNMGAWSANEGPETLPDIIQVNGINADNNMLDIFELIVDILDGRHGR